MPLVSVLFPVFNGAKFIEGSLRSILNQTYSDLEVLLINDGSTDATERIISSFPDVRIRYLRNERNMGIAASLNAGLEIAKGKYIARMDADDLALPRRIEMQVHFLESRGDIIACGTWARLMGTRTTLKPDHNCVRLRARLLFDSPLLHPTAVFRLTVLREKGIRYNENSPHTEDYDLWVRLAEVGRITNIRKTLLQFRVHSESITASNRAAQSRFRELLQRRQLARLGLDPTDTEMRIHLSLASGELDSELTIEDARRWCRSIAAANNVVGYTTTAAMGSVLRERLLALRAYETAFWRLPYSVCRAGQLFLTRR